MLVGREIKAWMHQVIAQAKDTTDSNQVNVPRLGTFAGNGNGMDYADTVPAVQWDRRTGTDVKHPM